MSSSFSGSLPSPYHMTAQKSEFAKKQESCKKLKKVEQEEYTKVKNSPLYKKVANKKFKPSFKTMHEIESTSYQNTDFNFRNSDFSVRSNHYTPVVTSIPKFNPGESPIKRFEKKWNTLPKNESSSEED